MVYLGWFTAGWFAGMFSAVVIGAAVARRSPARTVFPADKRDSAEVN